MLFGLLVICNISLSTLIGWTLQDVFAAFAVYLCVSAIAVLIDIKFKWRRGKMGKIKKPANLALASIADLSKTIRTTGSIL